jgi:hypothetical protein
MATHKASTTAANEIAALEETVEVLQAARVLVAAPSQWTRRAVARDRHGHPIAYSSPRADRYCALGALLRAYETICGPGTVERTLAANAEAPVRQPAAGVSASVVFRAYAGALASLLQPVFGQAKFSGLDVQFAGQAGSGDEEAEEDGEDCDEEVFRLIVGQFISGVNDSPTMGHPLIAKAFDMALDQVNEALRTARANLRRSGTTRRKENR